MSADATRVQRGNSRYANSRVDRRTSRRMALVRQRDTDIEVSVRKRIYAAGLRYRVNARPSKTLRSRADILFPRLRLAVYIDGCFWHGCPAHASWPKNNGQWWKAKILANRDRDARSTAALEGQGWRVLRFWSHQEADFIAAAIIGVVRQKHQLSAARGQGSSIVAT